MPYQTRRDLKEEISNLESQIRAANAERGSLCSDFERAKGMLNSLGYDLVPSAFRHASGETVLVWRKDQTQRETERLEAKAAAEAAIKSALEAEAKGRQQALALVLDALQIPGYKPTRFDGGITDTLVERFDNDLQTARRVRAEAKRATDEKLVEAGIASLFDPAGGQQGGIVGFAKGPVDLMGDYGTLPLVSVARHQVVADEITPEATERILAAVRAEVASKTAKKGKAAA